MISDMWARPVSLLCKQKDIDTAEYHRICHTLLCEPVKYHRKQWEYVYIIKMLEHHGMLVPGKKGLGFGCGVERLVPAFAKLGVEVLATDLDGEDAWQKGWIQTNQHSSNKSAFSSFVPSVCSEKDLERVSHRIVDMNQIPTDLMSMQWDFVWSSCSLEHLGSLKHGMDFVLSTIHCLKPGGVSVHTTEFNISSNSKTFESPDTSLYRKRDLLNLKNNVEWLDSYMYPLDFDLGEEKLDRYIDVPPYLGNDIGNHLKLEIEKFNCTSVGFCIRRNA